MDTVLLHLPDIHVNTEDAKRLQQGQFTPFEKGGRECEARAGGFLVRLYCNQHFLGIGEIIDGKLQPRRLLTCDYHAYSPK